MPDKDLSELDESFANLRLGNNSIVTSASRQNLVSQASTQQEDQEELIEPIRRIMRRRYGRKGQYSLIFHTGPI